MDVSVFFLVATYFAVHILIHNVNKLVFVTDDFHYPLWLTVVR